MPMYLLWGVLKVTCFTGKTSAILLILSISLFTFIGKTSMLVLLINAFLAIKFDLRYYTWRTNDKAIAIVAVEWLSCVVLSSLFCLQVFYIDFGNAPVTLYHHVYVAKNLTFVRTIMFVFIVSTIVFGVLVLWSVRRRKLHVSIVCLVSLLQYVLRREDANLVFALLTFRMLVFLHPCVNTFVVYSTKRCWSWVNSLLNDSSVDH